MKIVRGDLWKSKASLICVTANGYVGKDGLVMGRGAAAQAVKRFQDLKLTAGSTVSALGETVSPRTFLYGFVLTRPIGYPQGLGLFQVKYKWNEPAQISLIAFSALSLRRWLLYHYKETVACNFPGIGNGGLERQQVEPILREALGEQDRVTFHVKD